VTLLIILSTARSSRGEDFVDDQDNYYEDNQYPLQFQDPLDFDFRESPFEDDNDYEPSDNDNIEDDEDAHGHEIEYTKCDSAKSTNHLKRARSDSVDADTNKFEKARKVVKSSGRPTASDYTQEVQDVLNSAITFFKVDLLRIHPYPDRASELSWAKVGWGEANTLCDLKIKHNTELIKMVRTLIHTSDELPSLFARSHAVVRTCVASSKPRSNLWLSACLALKSLPMIQSEIATADLLRS
jgi:hypothetical protein